MKLLGMFPGGQQQGQALSLMKDLPIKQNLQYFDKGTQAMNQMIDPSNIPQLGSSQLDILRGLAGQGGATGGANVLENGLDIGKVQSGLAGQGSIDYNTAQAVSTLVNELLKGRR